MIDISNAFRRTPVRLCALALAAGVGGQAWADEVPSAYVMTVFDNQAQGKKVISGDYQAAISELTGPNRKHLSRSAASNNLCVAYTMTENLSEAEKACFQALQRSKIAASPWNDSYKLREDRAVAFSNRGVLRAVSGDAEGAEEDFQRAIRLSSSLEAPALNLARLSARTAQAVSSAQHAR